MSLISVAFGVSLAFGVVALLVGIPLLFGAEMATVLLLLAHFGNERFLNARFTGWARGRDGRVDAGDCDQRSAGRVRQPRVDGVRAIDAND